MQLFKQPKRIIKSTVASGTALALVLTPTAALAHGGGSSGNDSGKDNHQTAMSQQNQRNDRFTRNKNRQKLTCSQRQDALNKQAADTKAKDQKRVTGLNIVLNGTQTYVTTGDVVVTNYDGMNAQVTADQTAAANAVNAINAPDLHCEDQNSAAAVSDDNKTFKHDNDGMNNGIGAAQQAINTYRKDLNNLFEAVINS